ncbi:MAG: hypothetical protein MIO92_08070 [Methanosarcinaceae archaeon]|nr:hypothetical protein [Methanosarcinaceae archaeon]
MVIFQYLDLVMPSISLLPCEPNARMHAKKWLGANNPDENVVYADALV